MSKVSSLTSRLSQARRAGVVVACLVAIAGGPSCRCGSGPADPAVLTRPGHGFVVVAPVDAGHDDDHVHPRLVCPVDWEAIVAGTVPRSASPLAPGHDAPPAPADAAEDSQVPEIADELALDALLTASDDALAADKPDVALACAQEASRLFPDEPAAHRARALVFDATDTLDKARDALDRAFALDPDAPETLHDLAALLLRIGTDDALEAAVAHCERARAGLGAQDVAIAAGLAATEAAALNDLGRSLDALPAAESALALDETRDDARLERAVALLETLRFDEARPALEEAVRRLPDDARAVWFLGVSLERAGDVAAAREAFLRASTLDPEGYPLPLDLAADRFRVLVDEEAARLDEAEAARLKEVRLTVEDVPDEADLRAGDPILSPTIVGLYRPPDEGAPPDERATIVLYRLGLLRLGGDEAALRHEIFKTLRHELGHHDGEDDDALRDRGL